MRQVILLAAIVAVQGCASLNGEPLCTAPEAAPVAAAAEDRGHLRLMSWNVHGLPFDDSFPRRMANIAARIREVRPDVVLLQEVWLDKDAARFACYMRDQYDVVPESPGVREGWLAPFGHRRGGLLAMVRRQSGWRLDSSLVPAFVAYSESSPWYSFGELDGIAGKGIQEFAVTDGTSRLVVLHTHAQTQYPARGRPYDAVREAQMAQLLARARRPGGDPLLIVGDLNVRDDEPHLYGMLTAELEDLTAGYRRACGGCGTFVTREGTDAWWIDHLFARRDAAPLPAARIELIRNRSRDEPYSDHHGITAELRIR